MKHYFTMALLMLISLCISVVVYSIIGIMHVYAWVVGDFKTVKGV